DHDALRIDARRFTEAAVRHIELVRRTRERRERTQVAHDATVPNDRMENLTGRTVCEHQESHLAAANNLTTAVPGPRVLKESAVSRCNDYARVPLFSRNAIMSLGLAISLGMLVSLRC